MGEDSAGAAGFYGVEVAHADGGGGVGEDLTGPFGFHELVESVS